jgi:hypothetical protein
MAEKYPVLYGHANDVCEILYNVKDVASFIMKHGINTDVEVTTPTGALLLNTFGIFINRIVDMEYRDELLKVLSPMQEALFENNEDAEEEDDFDEYDEDFENYGLE